jgi:hypothetical protein
VVLLVVLLCTVSLSPLTAVAVSEPADGGVAASTQPVSAGAGAAASQVTTPANETAVDNESETEPVRHRDPRGLVEEGDLSELERALANLLASSLNESSVAIDRGEYERARSVLGDRYDSVLERYVRVTRETPEQRDDSAQFRSTRDEQSAFVDTVRTYREKRNEYDQAKRAGDESRARELARELNALAADAEQRNERLSDEYDTLGRQSETDFTTAKQSISNVQRNISAEQAVIRKAEFVETSLDVTGVGGGGSFVDPIVVSGTLVDETGTLLANRTVLIAVNGTEVETETDGNAGFAVSYRPVTDGLGEQRLTIEFLPRADSIYLGSQARARAVVTQSTPTVSIDDAPRSTRFGDRVVVSGSVAVDGRPATSVPLNVSIGDVRIGQLTSGELGDFRFEGSLPVSVDRGDQQLWVGYPFEDRALAPNRTATPIEVRTTETELTVDGRQAALESLAVAGRLLTSDGRSIAGQQVFIYVAGQQSAVVETSQTGLFATTVWLPSSTAGRSAASVVVVFNGTGSNLETSRASARIPIVATGSRSGGGGGGGSGDSASASDGGGGGGADGETEGGSRGSRTDVGADAVGGLFEDAAGPVGRAVLGVAGPLAAIELYGISVRGLTATLWFDAVVILVTLLVVAIGLGIVLARRRNTPSDVFDDAPVRASSPVQSVEKIEVPALLLEFAGDRIEAGVTRLGVEYAYLGARIMVASGLGIPNRGTHRRFATASATRLTGASSEQFRALTERYEQALFGARDPSVDDALAALTTARELVNRVEGDRDVSTVVASSDTTDLVLGDTNPDSIVPHDVSSSDD